MPGTHRFLCAPLGALARAMNERATTLPDFDELLSILVAADRKLDAQTHALQQTLRETQERLTETEQARAVAARERDEAQTVASEVAALKELVAAREEAQRAQHALVRQLKEDNEKLRESYSAAVRRAGDARALVNLAERGAPEESRRDRRISVVVGGNRKDMRFSDAELVYVFRENERLQKAGSDLVVQVEQQKNAHQKLRDTIAELMTQLQDNAKEREAHDEESSKKMDTLKKQLTMAQSESAQKDLQATTLQRELNKVLAEYQAVSVAHSYSNAELSRLRVTTRANKKADREKAGGGISGAVLGGVENLLHHRRAGTR